MWYQYNMLHESLTIDVTYYRSINSQIKDYKLDMFIFLFTVALQFDLFELQFPQPFLYWLISFKCLCCVNICHCLYFRLIPYTKFFGHVLSNNKLKPKAYLSAQAKPIHSIWSARINILGKVRIDTPSMNCLLL